MLTQEQEIGCLKIADAICNHYFHGDMFSIYNFIKFWNNYELHFVAEINDPDYNVIQYAEAIVYNRELAITKKTPGNITIAILCQNGLLLFPEESSLYGKLLDFRVKHLLENAKQLLEYGIDNNQLMGHLMTYDDYKKTQEDVFESMKRDSKYGFSMSPSIFYFSNEQIAEMIEGGVRKKTFNEIYSILNGILDTYETDSVVHDMLPKLFFDIDDWYKCNDYFGEKMRDGNTKVYIKGICHLPNSNLSEEIFNMSDRVNMIIYESRGFHDEEEYCPKSMIERISMLSYPMKVKEILQNTIKRIESEESPEIKIGMVNWFISEFKNKGWMDEYNGITEIYRELLDQKKKSETFAAQQQKALTRISRLIENQKTPEFLVLIEEKLQQRYKSILSNINKMLVPINTEAEKSESVKYIDVISDLGLFVGNIMTTILKADKEDITLSNFRHLTIKYPKFIGNDYKFLKEYSEDYGEFYNDCRKKPLAVKVDFNKTLAFIRASHNALEILMKYKTTSKY